METISLRTVAITAAAPAIWGTTYLTTSELLPPDRPLFAATVRALPAGLVLLAVKREVPSGIWWWRSLVLSVLTIGLFFPLLFVGAYHLPGGLAATLQAASPLAVIGLAWGVLGERPGLVRVVAAGVGMAGVGLLVLRSPEALSPLGVAAALASVGVSAAGFVLVKRWPAPVDMLTLVSWQLVGGGLLLLPVALLVEGGPPPVDLPAALGLLWLAGAGTVVAYACWFHGLGRMPAGAVGLIGLLNPVVGTLLGVVLAGEFFGATQAVGMALVLGGVIVGQPFFTDAIRRRAARSRRRREPLPCGHAALTDAC